jgi:hypothetical protein
MNYLLKNKMKNIFLIIIFVSSLILTTPSYAQLSNNSGFISGQIWYSQDILKEGKTVNVHTAVWNGDENQLSVKVEFYDKNVILGIRDLVVSPYGLEDVFVPWKVTSGDHLISAKIIYSVSNISGKKETISLVKNEVSAEKIFVPVENKESEVKNVSSNSEIENKIVKVGSEIGDALPPEITSSISDGFESVEVLREKTLKDVTVIKDKAQKDVNVIKSDNSSISKTLTEKKDVEYIVKKPIAYIKLFLFSVLSFILGNKILFYGLSLLVIFYILRFIYRKIRNR